MVIGRSSIGFSDLVYSHPHPIRPLHLPDHRRSPRIESNACPASGEGRNGSNTGKVRKMKRRFALAAFALPAMLAMGSTGWAQSATPTTPTAPNDSGINVRDRDAGAMTAGSNLTIKAISSSLRRFVAQSRKTTLSQRSRITSRSSV
jgi:hypothetical protein